jgi:hypothetical protein
MSAPARFRCADAAQLAVDPLEASAPPADQWLLVEHHGPWGRRALADTRLERVAAGAMQRWLRAGARRVALIRPPSGPDRGLIRRRWYLVDSRLGVESIRHGLLSNLRQLADVLADPHAGEPTNQPIYLVCSHGKHDTCCALRGRPVAAALAHTWPHRTWECTHVGGDRFAGNLVVLPHGLYYGRLTSAAAVEVASRYNAGLLEPRLLRGRSSLPAPVQAAQHHARLALGDRRVEAYPPIDHEPLDRDTWRVRLAGPGSGVVTVLVRAQLVSTDRPLTCSGTAPDQFRIFDLVDLHQSAPTPAAVPGG